MIWRFTLTDYTFNPAGDSTVVPEPQGWEGAKFIFRRDLKWHGIFFDYTLSNLTFYSEGYTIIKDAYEEKGILANTDLLIEVQCDYGDYDTFFEGKLNYSNLKFVSGDTCGVSIGIEQTGCLQEFVTRYDQKVNLASLTSFGGEELQEYTFLNYETELPSKDILYSSVASMDNFTIDYTDAFPRLTGQVAQYFFGLGFTDIQRDDLQINPACDNAGLGIDGYTIDNFFENCIPLVTPPVDVLLCDSENLYQVDLHVKCSGTEFSIDTRQYNFIFSLAYGNTTDGFTIVPLYTDGNIPSGGATENLAFDITHSDTYTLRAGIDSIFLYVGLTNYQYTTGGANGFDLSLSFEIGEFSISTQSLCADSNAKVFLINETLSRITESITDDCMKVYSEYYGRTDSEPYATDDDGCGGRRYLTNGLLVRNAVLQDNSQPVFSLSFKDCFDGLNAIDNIGIGIEDDPNRAAGYKMIRVEDVAYFYQSSLNAICAEVKEVEIAFDDKRAFSTIEVGYKKWEPEQTGGLDDIHSKRIYRTEQGAIANTLNIQSNFIASNYSLETTRRQGQSTTDWKYDNETFIVCFGEIIYGNLNTFTDFAPAAGNNLIALIYYNQRISPVRNLLHWFKSISPTWNYEFLTQLRKLKFTSGEANYVAGWQKTANDDCLLELQSDYLYENQDIDKTTFKDYDDCKPIWMPETISFDYPLTYQQFRTIRNNPYRRVQVTQSGRTWYGWIEQLEYDPNKGMGKWKLIRQYEDNY